MRQDVKENHNQTLPLFAALLILLSAACFFVSSIQNFLIFDRSAIIQGEIWRLFTGNAVHFFFFHALFDIAILILAYCLVEKIYIQKLEWVAVLCFCCIGPFLFFLDPSLSIYGGLSGIASGCFLFAIKVNYITSNTSIKYFYGLVLVLCLVKVFLELLLDDSMFVQLPSNVRNVPLSHLLGYIIALLFPLGNAKDIGKAILQ
jgi:rhomboid family GlyGly-CTERM serine protease